ncbi:MAG: hypothetical protein NTV07_00090 [Candidatus Omnitrophica bacterium]|nr:hypothetical protein [Candidatus Omnitrophota bacterium]
MNKNLKKIVTREALIISGIMMLSVMLVWISVPAGHHYEYFSTIGLKNPYPFFGDHIFALLYAIGVRLAFFGYPVYLAIRSIVWAIRALKKKTQIEK